MPRHLLPAIIILPSALLLSSCAARGGGSVQAAASGAAASQQAAGDLHTITSQGIGTVTATPDTVTVVIGVQTGGVTAKTALDVNNQRANALIAALKAKGVASKDLVTSELSVQPTYAPKSSTINGYQVSDTVSATLHNIPGAGGLIDAAAKAAGNAVRVQQISFSIADDAVVLSLARAKAVKQASAQAAQMAKAAGVTLGTLRTIVDVPDPSGQYAYAVPSAAAGAGVADASVPIQAGSQKLAVTVRVSYDIG